MLYSSYGHSQHVSDLREEIGSLIESNLNTAYRIRILEEKVWQSSHQSKFDDDEKEHSVDEKLAQLFELIYLWYLMYSPICSLSEHSDLWNYGWLEWLEWLNWISTSKEWKTLIRAEVSAFSNLAVIFVLPLI